MLQNSFGVHLSFASVDRGDGSDPRETAHDILFRLRVPAGLRDAGSAWGDREEAAFGIPVTDDGRVLTLSEDDLIETTLSAQELKLAFHEHGLMLWMDVGGDEAADGIDHLESVEEVVHADEEMFPAELEADSSSDPALFAAHTVKVSAFSHRGPGMARVLASARGITVDHRESGDWSLQQFETSEPTGHWVGSKAELPLIELNRADTGAWFEVTVGSGGPIPFWTEAERDTRAVLDIEAIRVAETAEIYRRLLTEGDGSRDDLLEISAVVALDVDAAHRALLPEALGGVVGAEARQRAFVSAFGVPSGLIDAAVHAESAVAGAVRRFSPVGWWPALRETAIAGVGEFTPLTRRGRLLSRAADALRRRPSLGLALTFGELAAGVWAVSRWRGTGRALGVVIVIDAVIDTTIWLSRLRRNGRG